MTNRPNLLIINPDQMRADALAHLGNPAAHTPNLDLLAREAVSFSGAFCQNPVCVPSRCSFMTGLYPHVNGHRTMGFLLQPHEENLFGDFKSAGYRTISSHRSDLMAGQYPRYHKALIDEYIKVHPKRPLKYFTPPHHGDDHSFLHGIVPEKYAKDMDDLIVDGAVRSIQKNAGERRPFFMFVGLMLPHPPYQIEQKYYDLIDKSALPSRIPTIQDGDKKPLMERGLRDALHIDGRLFDDIRVTYLAMCAKVDAQIGLLLQALKTADIYDDTAVMIFSDHGDYTGDFGLAEKSQNCFPDCLTNVPLIIKPAKGTPVDTGINDNLAELVDIAATAAGLTGITIERTHFSRSLLPTLRDKSTPHRAFVSCEGGRNPGETHCSEFENYRPGDHYAPRLELQHLEDGTHGKAVMLRTKTYKYIRRLQEPDEFYDLAQGERQNLIDDPRFAEQIADAKRRLLDWFIETADAVPTRIDSRFSLDLLKNGIRAAKAPAFLGDILGLWLRLTKTTPGQFMAKLQGLAERNKK